MVRNSVRHDMARLRAAMIGCRDRSFASFAVIWRENDFDLLADILKLRNMTTTRGNKQRRILSEMVTYLLSSLPFNRDFDSCLWVVYTLYALDQVHRDVFNTSEALEIPVPAVCWRVLVDFFHEAQSTGHLEAEYILLSLHDVGAFYFTSMEPSTSAAPPTLHKNSHISAINELGSVDKLAGVLDTDCLNASRELFHSYQESKNILRAALQASRVNVSEYNKSNESDKLSDKMLNIVQSDISDKLEEYANRHIMERNARMKKLVLRVQSAAVPSFSERNITGDLDKTNDVEKRTLTAAAAAAAGAERSRRRNAIMERQVTSGLLQSRSNRLYRHSSLLVEEADSSGSSARSSAVSTPRFGGGGGSVTPRARSSASHTPRPPFSVDDDDDDDDDGDGFRHMPSFDGTPVSSRPSTPKSSLMEAEDSSDDGSTLPYVSLSKKPMTNLSAISHKRKRHVDTEESESCSSTYTRERRSKSSK